MIIRHCDAMELPRHCRLKRRVDVTQWEGLAHQRLERVLVVNPLQQLHCFLQVFGVVIVDPCNDVMECMLYMYVQSDHQ